MKNIAIILTCLLSPMLGLSQDYYTHTYSVDDGLPSNHINCLYQDQVGRIWIGTDAGIGIFDGNDFRILNKHDGLASNDVRSIIQDEEGSYWFACYDGGLTKYDGTNFTSITVEDGLHSNFIRRVYYSKTYQTLFIGGDDGFYTYTDGRIDFYGKANGQLAEEHEILWFLEAKGFVYVFPFKDFVIKFYPKTKTIIQDKEFTDTGKPILAPTSALVTLNKDTIWEGTAITKNDTIIKLDSDRIGLSFNLCEDDEGKVWIPIFGSVASGLLRYNGEKVVDYSFKLGLDNIKLNNVLFDKKSGTLWMASDNNGLIAFPKPKFRYVPTSSFLDGEHEFRHLKFKDGTMYAVYKDIITKFHSGALLGTIPISLIKSYPPVKKRINSFPVNSIWRNLNFNEITFDTENRLWISTNMGLLRMSADEKKISGSIIPMPRFRYGWIAFDRKDNLYNWGYWIDTLSIFSQPKQFNNSPYQQFSLANYNLPKEISKMLPINDNMLFSSIYGGLYSYDGQTFKHLNESNPELPENVSCVCKDIDGNVIFCTNTGEIGLGKFEGSRFDVIHQWNDLDPFYGRNFIWVITDNQNNIYAGTNRGLLVINYADVNSSPTKDIRFFSKSEGYSDFSVTSPILDDEENIWLGSQENLLCIYTNEINSFLSSPNTIMLTQFETTDSTYTFKNGTEPADMSQWSFPYTSNNLTFQFNSINLLNPEKDRFSIQLEGFDKSYKDVGSDRKVNYTNLPAGNYKFNVRSSNLNTLQQQSHTLLEFVIRTPYWQTWWFYLGLIIMLIGLISLLYIVRERRIRKTAMLKLEMANMEMQALQAQMNPHFVFNVFNSLQRYILERDVNKSINLLGDFSKMIRQTFNLSSKKIITLTEEINYLDSYLKLEQVRFAYKFKYQISADPNIDADEVMIPSMLIQPMVENAVKHGLTPLKENNGVLTVTFSIHGNKTLKCEIKDNGIGIDKSLSSKRDNTTRLSKALTITQRRIELLGASSKNDSYSVSVTDQSKIDPNLTGTLVEIVLPVRMD